MTILAALSHKATSDDQYCGYHIPANAVVMINAWYVDSYSRAPSISNLLLQGYEPR